MRSLILFACCVLFAHTAQSRPQQHHELAPVQETVGIVGDIDGTAPIVRKAASDTTWMPPGTSKVAMRRAGYGQTITFATTAMSIGR